MMAETKLTRRALNRALLARQMLLAREILPAAQAIERLVGLQAQQARPPFVGLWSRLEGFQREELLNLIRSRAVVRATLMRATLHLWTARDYLALRSTLQPALSGAARAVLGARTESFDLNTLLAAARELFGEGAQTFAALRPALLARFPEADERAMGYAVRTHLPLVTAPAEHPWGFRADAEFALAEPWLGRSVEAEARPEALALRYLAAFGPAAAADLQAWWGGSGLSAVLRALRPQLLVFRDERGREVFDLPDAPRPPEETPAPPRFIADFDNLVLSHADRSRVIADAHRAIVVTRNGMVLPTILVDGFVAGTWKVTRVRKTTILTVSPFAHLTAGVRETLAAEGEEVARFIEPDAEQVNVAFEEK